MQPLTELARDGLVKFDGTCVRVRPEARAFVRGVASVFDTDLASAPGLRRDSAVDVTLQLRQSGAGTG